MFEEHTYDEIQDGANAPLTPGEMAAIVREAVGD